MTVFSNGLIVFDSLVNMHKTGISITSVLSKNCAFVKHTLRVPTHLQWNDSYIYILYEVQSINNNVHKLLKQTTFGLLLSPVKIVYGCQIILGIEIQTSFSAFPLSLQKPVIAFISGKK